MTFKKDLKQQPVCQGSPKDILSDSGQVAIPFTRNRDPQDSSQQPQLEEVIH